MKVVVTGADGFIGSQVVLALQRRMSTLDILAVDHPLQGRTKNRALISQVPSSDHETFIEVLEKGLSAPDVIIHLGACSDTTEKNWDYLRTNNLEYSQRVWRWCAANGKRLIYASSAATYGDGSLGFDDEAPIAPLLPLNLYGKSKQDFDLWLYGPDARQDKWPAQTVGLKFFNVFGPGEAHKGRMASMVFHGARQIQETGKVRLFGSSRPGFADGSELRDFIYVRDVVDVILNLIDQPEVSGLFNLGTGHARSFKDLIEALFAAMGIPPNIEYIPMPEDLKGKYQYFTEAKMVKLARAGIRYSPVTLEEAVKDYWRSSLAPDAHQ